MATSTTLTNFWSSPSVSCVGLLMSLVSYIVQDVPAYQDIWKIKTPTESKTLSYGPKWYFVIKHTQHTATHTRTHTHTHTSTHTRARAYTTYSLTMWLVLWLLLSLPLLLLLLMLHGPMVSCCHRVILLSMAMMRIVWRYHTPSIIGSRCTSYSCKIIPQAWTKLTCH